MVEAMYAHKNNGPKEPQTGIEASGNAVGAPNREWKLETEQNKLPINLCRKPNKQTMTEDEYIDSIREMMNNRIFLDEDERQAFGFVVKQGIPASLRP